MSTTLARRIRRIGIEPTTYTKTTETRLVKDENGRETSQEVTISKPMRHRESLTLDELKAHVSTIRAEYRVRNLAFRADRRKARLAKSAKPKIASTKKANPGK
jgi:hypothetical protein